MAIESAFAKRNEEVFAYAGMIGGIGSFPLSAYQKAQSMTPLSILELARITQATDARGALDNARDLAAHAETWGYRRIWVAEHHNMAASPVRRHLSSSHTPHIAARNEDDPRGRWRHHAAQPCALCDRRAVRNAGAAVPGSHRPRAWPRTGHGPAHSARFAPHTGIRRELSAGCSRTAGLPGASPVPISASRQYPPQERTCRCGFSDRAISAPCSPQN